MNRFDLVKTICGLSALLVFTPVFAESDSSDSFKQLDVNRDGYISTYEAKGETELLSDWKNVDQNSDGRLEMSEFSAFEEVKAYDDFDKIISD